MGHGDMQRRDTPGIFQVRVDGDEVFVTGKRLPESSQSYAIHSLPHGLLVGRAESFSTNVELGGRCSLEAIAANEIRLLRSFYQVAIANDIDAVSTVWTAIRPGSILELGQLAACTRSGGMVHQSTTQQTARIAKTFRVAAGG